jgi:chromosome segregation ATPase
LEPEKDVTEDKEDVAKRIEGLERQLAEKALALDTANNRIAGMETEGNKQREEIAALKSQHVAVSGDIETIKGALSEAVKGYRELIIAANPVVPAELVGGETVAALAASLEKAKGLVGRVRQAVAAESAKSRIPAGAPVRMTADTNTLSAREKIARGIGKE